MESNAEGRRCTFCSICSRPKIQRSQGLLEVMVEPLSLLVTRDFSRWRPTADSGNPYFFSSTLIRWISFAETFSTECGGRHSINVASDLVSSPGTLRLSNSTLPS